MRLIKWRTRGAIKKMKRFLKDFKSGKGTSSNVEELEGRLLALIRSPPICGQTPWKLRELERLILKGAPVPHTALHFACINHDIATVKLLVKYGANVNGTWNDASTPLHAALSVSHGHQICELIKLLHKHGAGLNALNSRGETPLHLAATSQFIFSARTLISLGADPFLSTYENRGMACPKGKMARPIGHALTSGRLELFLLFLQNGDSFEDYESSTLSYVYSRRMNIEIVKLLVEAGLRVPQGFFHGEKRLSFINWPDSFIKWLTSPKPLQLQCMRTIRNSIGKRNLEKIADLQLPTKLKDRLMFKSEGIEIKHALNCCVNKDVIKSSRRQNCFNVYEHNMPCKCI